jgi:hypothetical protein
MTPSPLDTTDEQDSVDENLSSEELARLAETPASELMVKLDIRKHARGCWAKARLRRYTLAAYFLAGAVTVFQVGGFFVLRSIVRDTIRATVEQVLKEHKLAGTRPPSTGDVMLVATGGML